MEELQLKDFLQIIRKRLWVVIIITLIAIIATSVYTFFVQTPIYQSDTSLYVISKKVDAQAAINYNDLLAGNQLAKDYQELVKSRAVSNMVIDELGLKNISARQIAAKLGVSVKSETRIIQITAQDPDPRMAKVIVSKVAEVFMDKAIEIMEAENVQIIDKAEVPLNPIKPNPKMNIAIASLLGLMLSLGLVFLLEYFDNTIKTPDDVMKHTGLAVIGTIPVFPE